MKYLIIASLFLFNACQKQCTEELRLGEILQIPIQFNGFSLNELYYMKVIRMSKDLTVKNDTLMLEDIAWGHQIKDNNIIITDDDKYLRFGDYESYFNQCDLIFLWQSGRDTLKNMVVLKSREIIKDECHKDDPNVRIDKVSFLHKQKLFTKNEQVIISK